MNKETEEFYDVVEEVGGRKIIIEVEKGGIRRFELVDEGIEKG
ncbi:hypothetical protein [Priestia megaterium]|nr:hypothetical protein [Priestia megaterium]